MSTIKGHEAAEEFIDRDEEKDGDKRYGTEYAFSICNVSVSVFRNFWII
jgi:hypothetical protein